jgi:hypothetical protein
LLPVFITTGLIETAVVEQLLEHVVATAAARLPGFRRVALAGVAWSVLVPAPGDAVEGSVLLDLGHEDLRRLDAYGGVGEFLYRRSAVLVEIEGRAAAEPAFIYLPTERTLRLVSTVRE